MTPAPTNTVAFGSRLNSGGNLRVARAELWPEDATQRQRARVISAKAVPYGWW